MFKVLVMLLLSVSFGFGLASCTYSQSQHAESVMNRDYQDYLVKKQELVLFEQARTAQELKDWK